MAEDERRSKKPPFAGHEAGSLAERLAAAPPLEQEESPPPRRGRALAARIAYWTATGLGTLSALTLLVAAGAISAQHQARLEEQARPGFEAQDRAAAARQSMGELPDRNEAEHRLNQATTVAERVAEAQNTYLEHSGPLPLDELPEETPDAGERDECVSYLEERPTTPREYTDEELTACAEGIREEAIGGLERRLAPHFSAETRDTDGFDPVGRWHDLVPALEEDDSSGGRTWTTHKAFLFEDDSSIPMVWTLTDDETGAMVAWVRGSFDPVAKKFDRMVLGAVSVPDDDADEGPDGDNGENIPDTRGEGAEDGDDTVDGEASDETDDGGRESEGDRG